MCRATGSGCASCLFHEMSFVYIVLPNYVREVVCLTSIGTAPSQRGPLQRKRILLKVRGTTTGQPGSAGTAPEVAVLLLIQHHLNHMI